MHTRIPDARARARRTETKGSKKNPIARDSPFFVRRALSCIYIRTAHSSLCERSPRRENSFLFIFIHFYSSAPLCLLPFSALCLFRLSIKLLSLTLEHEYRRGQKVVAVGKGTLRSEFPKKRPLAIERERS